MAHMGAPSSLLSASLHHTTHTLHLPTTLTLVWVPQQNLSAIPLFAVQALFLFILYSYVKCDKIDTEYNIIVYMPQNLSFFFV